MRTTSKNRRPAGRDERHHAVNYELDVPTKEEADLAEQRGIELTIRRAQEVPDGYVRCHVCERVVRLTYEGMMYKHSARVRARRGGAVLCEGWVKEAGPVIGIKKVAPRPGLDRTSRATGWSPNIEKRPPSRQELYVDMWEAVREIMTLEYGDREAWRLSYETRKSGAREVLADVVRALDERAKWASTA